MRKPLPHKDHTLSELELPNKGIKIALIGTSCTGKTTITKAFQNVSNPDIGIVHEAAREYFESVHAAERFSFNDQKNIQNLVMKREREMGSKYKMILCDRSVLCPIMYTIANGDRKGGEALFERAQLWISSYKHFFLLDPYEVPYTQDSIRRESENFRLKVHEEYLAFLKEKEIQYTLIKGSLEKRINKIKEFIVI